MEHRGYIFRLDTNNEGISLSIAKLETQIRRETHIDLHGMYLVFIFFVLIQSSFVRSGTRSKILD